MAVHPPKTPKTKTATTKEASFVTPVKRAKVDWEKVETSYRLGVQSIRSIAAEHGCTDTAIRLKAKEQDWTRDLSAKVKAATAELLRKDELRTALRTNPAAKATEREQIDISAKVKTDVILAHRKDIPIARALTMQMLSELQLQTSGIELLEELGEMMRNPNEAGQDKRNDLYNKVIALSGRSSTLKSLADSLKVLVGLEREAFGLNEADASPRDALTELLQGIAGGNTSAFKPIARDIAHDEEE